MKLFDKYYHTLGVTSDADEGEIKRAYRAKAKLYHPDRSGNQNTREQFIQVNEAYEVLMQKDSYVRDAIDRYKEKHRSTESQRPHRDPAYKAKKNRQYQTDPRYRAEAYADMRFKDFEKSPIYKTAVVFNSFFNYLMLFIGFSMMASPIIGYLNFDESDRFAGKENVFQVFPMILGSAFLYGVWYFLFKHKH